MLQRSKMCDANSVLDGIIHSALTQQVWDDEKFVMNFAFSDMRNKVVEMTMKL